MFKEINHPSHVSNPLRCAWSPPNHHFLTARVECWSVETSRLLSEEISFDCGAKCQHIISNLFYKQTHCTRPGIDTKGRQTNTLHDRIDTKVKQTYLDQQVRHLILRCQELFLLELISCWIDLPKGWTNVVYFPLKIFEKFANYQNVNKNMDIWFINAGDN